MRFNEHSEIKETHAFLSASQYHWLNYDEEKLTERYLTWKAAERGTKLHEFAKSCIELKVKLKGSGTTLAMYVNDAIGFDMKPEQILYYSDNCYGTADAIKYADRMLRIHDLKTGVAKASMNQLYIYDALFCLEYDVRPNEITIENRIYQNDERIISRPDNDTIFHIMDKIISFDKHIEFLKLETEVGY